MTVAQSTVLYGSEVWADALKKKTYRKRIAGVQYRGALRIACSYLTVSEPAVLVTAGVIPLDILAFERKRIFAKTPENGKANADARESSRILWKRRWDNDTRGRWTARLILRLSAWIDHKHGEVNYYLTQFLSGHGYFQAYLHRIGKVPSASCMYCGTDADDAEHTFFKCECWAGLRAKLATEVGDVIPDNVIKMNVKRSQTSILK